MNKAELKTLLLELAEEEPDFMTSLVGEVIKSHLCIDSASDGDCYNPSKTYILLWTTDECGYQVFSKAY